MEIKMQIGSKVYSLCFGRKTDWFEEVYLVSLTELVISSDKEVVGGFLIFGWFQDKEYK